MSKYPGQIDDATTIPAAVDLVTPVNAEGYNRLRDAILAIEAELGTDPSRVFGSVGSRLDNFDALIATLTTRMTTAEGRLDAHDITLVSLQAQIDVLTAASEAVTTIVSGIQSTDSTTFTAIGAGVINPTTLGHPGSTFTVEVILQTTDASFAASFELFNITEGITIAHPTITTTSISATLISVVLTAGGADLPTGQTNVLEGRLRLAAGAAPSDRAICKYAAINFNPS